MDYHVKNDSWRDKAFRVLGGLSIVPAGTEKVVEQAAELTPEQIAALEAEGCLVTNPKAKPAPVKPAK